MIENRGKQSDLTESTTQLINNITEKNKFETLTELSTDANKLYEYYARRVDHTKIPKTMIRRAVHSIKNDAQPKHKIRNKIITTNIAATADRSTEMEV